MKLLSISNVLLVAVLVVSVRGGCLERDRRETVSESSSDSGLTGFFSNLRCTIQSGARQVKETVGNGYSFVMQKLSTTNESEKGDDKNDENIQNDDSNSNTHKHNNGTISILNNDRIIFKNDNGESIEELYKTSTIVNGGSVLTRPVTLDIINKTNVTIGDRNAISAPIVCPKGQKLVDQKCVTIVEF